MNNLWNRKQPKTQKRKEFRKERREYFAKLNKSTYSWFELVATIKKVVFSAKMTDVKFKNKSVTGSNILEKIINEVDLGKGETIQSCFAKYVLSYDSRKGDFKKLSQMFRIFLPKMTQVIMGEIYDFAIVYQRWNRDYKADLDRRKKSPNFREKDIYYDSQLRMNDERLKPMTDVAYKYFAQKLFQRRYPEYWNIVKPNIPLIGKYGMKIGQSDYDQEISFSVVGTKIKFDMSMMKKQFEQLYKDTNEIKYYNLLQKLEESDDNN